MADLMPALGSLSGSRQWVAHEVLPRVPRSFPSLAEVSGVAPAAERALTTASLGAPRPSLAVPRLPAPFSALAAPFSSSGAPITFDGGRTVAATRFGGGDAKVPSLRFAASSGDSGLRGAVGGGAVPVPTSSGSMGNSGVRSPLAVDFVARSISGGGGEVWDAVTASVMRSVLEAHEVADSASSSQRGFQEEVAWANSLANMSSVELQKEIDKGLDLLKAKTTGLMGKQADRRWKASFSTVLRKANPLIFAVESSIAGKA